MRRRAQLEKSKTRLCLNIPSRTANTAAQTKPGMSAPPNRPATAAAPSRPVVSAMAQNKPVVSAATQIKPAVSSAQTPKPSHGYRVSDILPSECGDRA